MVSLVSLSLKGRLSISAYYISPLFFFKSPSIPMKKNETKTFIFPHRVVEMSLHSIIISRLQSWKQSGFAFLTFSFVFCSTRFCVFKWHILFLLCVFGDFPLLHPISFKSGINFCEAIIANGILNASEINLFLHSLRLTKAEAKAQKFVHCTMLRDDLHLSMFSPLRFVCLIKEKTFYSSGAAEICWRSVLGVTLPRGFGPHRTNQIKIFIFCTFSSFFCRSSSTKQIPQPRF